MSYGLNSHFSYEDIRITGRNRDQLIGRCPPEVTKVLFLDIDGVLQPCWKQDRFKHLGNKDLQELYQGLFDRTGLNYSWYDKYDVTAVFYDWVEFSVNQLKRILDTAGAKIVVSSAWRTSNLYKMHVLFKIHGLDKYYIDNTQKFNSKIYNIMSKKKKYENIHSERVIEILEYINKYKHISKFVAVDDLDLSRGLENHFVRIDRPGFLIDEHADKCIEVLS
jgi:hypothetical protein